MSQQIDPRGQQFAAALTSAVLAGALLALPGATGIVLLAVQAALFATAVVLGVQRTPVAALFRSVVRPHIGAPAHLEDATPPRFAQGIGLAFTLAALVAFAFGAETVGFVATAFALVAALLNASIGLCLGCEVYLLGRQVLARARTAAASATSALPPTPLKSIPNSTGTRSST